MRLKTEALRKRCKGPLHLIKFLDLSGLELVKLDHLEQLENLHWLTVRNNNLEGDDGLENLKQLWYLDLSNNNISLLNALSRYLALGTLILSNNNLKWIDLEKIRHAHFLSISLHGNPCLDSDPYYRIHVIDCLPLIWELDGRLVTVTERLHVKQFFIDTALTAHPIRHKMGRTFRTTAVKNIGTMGVVSKQCKYIYSKFPMSETHTKHTDERRLRYLTKMLQQDILQWVSDLEKKDSAISQVTGNFLEHFLEQRHHDVERCNMILLLLVISLEYELPKSLIKATLFGSHLNTIGTANIIPYFLLPPSYRTRVVCILLNAAKVDRDNNVERNGGLYPQLFMSLYYAVAQLTRISQTSEANMHKIRATAPDSDYKALMAGEAVSLMLQVPRFLNCFADPGVASLTLCATGNQTLINESKAMLLQAEDIFGDITMRQAHKKVTDDILSAVHRRLDSINIKMVDIPVGDRYLALSDSLPIKPLHSVIWASQYLTNGQRIPKLEPPILNPAREAAKEKPQEPKIGDKVLLGPQVVGEIHLLLKGDIALVKIDGVPVSTGGIVSKVKDSEAHYTYIDLKAMCYARDIGMWRSIKTAGDKYNLHSVGTKPVAQTGRRFKGFGSISESSKDLAKKYSVQQRAYSSLDFSERRSSLKITWGNDYNHNYFQSGSEGFDKQLAIRDSSSKESARSGIDVPKKSKRHTRSAPNLSRSVYDPSLESELRSLVPVAMTQDADNNQDVDKLFRSPEVSPDSLKKPSLTPEPSSVTEELPAPETKNALAPDLGNEAGRLENSFGPDVLAEDDSRLEALETNSTFLTNVIDQEEGLEVNSPVSTAGVHHAESTGQSMTDHLLTNNDLSQGMNSPDGMSKSSASQPEDTNRRPDSQMKVSGQQMTPGPHKSRPSTAATPKTIFQFPPPQRPTSPTTIRQMKSPSLRVAQADKWLAGGRDLYWEEVRNRPRSGHTPGWKEGLPANMRRPRPKSAFTSPMLVYPQEASQGRVSYLSSCSNCQSVVPTHHLNHFGEVDDLDVTYVPLSNLEDSQMTSQHDDRSDLMVQGFRVARKGQSSSQSDYSIEGFLDVSRGQQLVLASSSSDQMSPVSTRHPNTFRSPSASPHSPQKLLRRRAISAGGVTLNLYEQSYSELPIMFLPGRNTTNQITDGTFNSPPDTEERLAIEGPDVKEPASKTLRTDAATYRPRSQQEFQRKQNQLSSSDRVPRATGNEVIQVYIEERAESRLD
ncbi:unnamed protein product [Lymnaea stagnalis]|uniref:Uncharacterized protein n=1 Tax=Lymnaea stagnalis TaxID=6523 RepID=A0AAV2I222_LYMST